jgi:hypothetical protein
MRQRSRPVRHLHCSRSCSPVTLVVSSMLMCRGAATHALYLHSPGIPWHGGQRHTRSRPFRSTVPCTRRSSCKAWMRSLVTHSSFASGPSRRLRFFGEGFKCQMAKKTTWRPRAPGGRGDARGEPGRCGDGTPRVSAQKADGIPFKRALAPTGSESARAISRRRLGPSAGSRFVGRAVPRAGVHRAGALERIRARGGVRARMLPVETCVARTGLRVTHFGGNVGA